MSVDAATVPGVVPLSVSGFTVGICDGLERSSTTVDTAGGQVLVIATTLPDHPAGLTSCYLSQLGGAIGATHLHRAADRVERINQYVISSERPMTTVAASCLLNHASELREALSSDLRCNVKVDVSVEALEEVSGAWGPPAPNA